MSFYDWAVSGLVVHLAEETKTCETYRLAGRMNSAIPAGLLT